MNTLQQIERSSWAVFDGWQPFKMKVAAKLNWQAFDELIPLHNAILDEQYKVFLPLLTQWDSIFAALGKDPTHQNWDRFRPLRLTREEDWADWLAHLIQTSTSGNFSSYLLQIKNVSDYSNPVKVIREDMHRKYRADLIIEWRKQKFTHIEVKIGDMNLSKTFPTSKVFREKYRVKKEDWSNFILLLSEQILEWNNIANSTISNTIINPISWEDVCIALRKAMLQEESITWKVWAYTFLGAIEQLIIGYKGYQLDNTKPRENLYKKINILERALNHD